MGGGGIGREREKERGARGRERERERGECGRGVEGGEGGRWGEISTTTHFSQ